MVRRPGSLLGTGADVLRTEGPGALLWRGSRYLLSGLGTEIARRLPHDVGIQGEYTTGNVGDRAVGEAIAAVLGRRGYRTRLLPATVPDSNAETRILGGGGVLHDWYGVDPLRTRLSYVADGGVVLGVGVPGLRSRRARAITAEALSNAELATVRDDRSRETLAEVTDTPVERTADPAFVLSSPGVETNGRTGINARPWFELDAFLADREDYESVMSYYFDYDDALDHERATEAYLDTLRRVCASVEDPVFVPFHRRDERFAREYLDVEVLPYRDSVAETLARVDAVERMVTMRYHSLVFAALCRTPVLAIDYAPKVRQLADRLELPSYRPHETVPVRFDRPRNVDRVKRSAARNFDLLWSHLS